MGNCTIIDCKQNINASSFDPLVTPDPDITGVGVRLLLAPIIASVSLFHDLIHAMTGSSSICNLWIVDTRALPRILYDRPGCIVSTP